MAEATTDTSAEDLSGLKSKNTELMGKLKAAEKRAREAEEAAEAAAEEAAVKGGDELSKLKRELAKAQKDAEAHATRADTAEKTLKTFRADNAIANAIASHNVDSKHVRAITALLKMDMEFADDGTPTIDGKSVDAYAKAYFAKDGLSYVRAPDNGGGVAQGSDGTQATKWSKAPETAEEYNEFMKLSVSDKAQANALAKQWNRPELAS